MSSKALTLKLPLAPDRKLWMPSNCCNGHNYVVWDWVHIYRAVHSYRLCRPVLFSHMQHLPLFHYHVNTLVFFFLFTFFVFRSLCLWVSVPIPIPCSLAWYTLRCVSSLLMLLLQSLFSLFGFIFSITCNFYFCLPWILLSFVPQHFAFFIARYSTELKFSESALFPESHSGAFPCPY